MWIESYLLCEIEAVGPTSRTLTLNYTILNAVEVKA